MSVRLKYDDLIPQSSFIDSFMRRKPLVFGLAIVVILSSVFFFILPQTGNDPVTREQAIAVVGRFQQYESSKNYCEITLEDGSCYAVFPHTEPAEFRERMEQLQPGVRLELLIHPNNDYVIGVTAEGEELLDFEAIQRSTQRYGYGYIGIGVFMCLASVFLIACSFLSESSEKEEKARRDRMRSQGTDSSALRMADPTKKTRTLLSASKKGYQIDYRRIGHVNELLINGNVYDEKRAILEFAHNLIAVVDGHRIEAGYDGNEYSYIRFDGEQIAQRRRLI